jgi:hypothetical protein
MNVELILFRGCGMGNAGMIKDLALPVKGEVENLYLVLGALKMTANPI